MSKLEWMAWVCGLSWLLALGLTLRELLRAEVSAYALHAALAWRKRHLYARLALAPCPARLPSLIKLRSPDRRVLEQGLARRSALPTSALAQLLRPSPP